MALHMQTVAFLMNYINSKLNEGDITVESVHVSGGYINEDGNLVLSFNNSEKEPIVIDLSNFAQSEDLNSLKDELIEYVNSNTGDYGEI